MLELDKRYIHILELLEDVTISYSLMCKCYGQNWEDIEYLIDEKHLASYNDILKITGKGRNYLANYRACKKIEDKEDKRWEITKRQAVWGIIIGGVGIVASLVMSILALVLK